MSKNKTFINLVILAMFISLFSLSCTSGKNDNSDTEIKQLLSQAIKGIESLEKENASLKAKLDKSTKGSITRANKAVMDDLKKAQNENAALKAEVEKITSLVSHTKLQLEAKEKEMNDQITASQQEISKLKGMLSFSRLQLETKQEEENARIAELEKDNSALQDILKKIHSITNKQQPAADSIPKN